MLAGAELDASWKQSLGRALLEGQRFGVELQFTYGPLGYFVDSPYEPALYWTKTVAYEVVLRLVVRGLRGGAIARVPGAVERVLCALCALLLPAAHDAWAFLVVTSIGCWYFARPERGVLHESLGTAVLVVLSLSKFTWLMHAAVVWAIFGLWCAHAHGRTARCARRRSRPRCCSACGARSASGRSTCRATSGRRGRSPVATPEAMGDGRAIRISCARRWCCWA